MAAESCNSRAFSWLIKSCFPNPHNESPRETAFLTPISVKIMPENSQHSSRNTTTLAFDLPDDLLLECLSRVSPASLSAVSLVCRRWSQLIDSSTFYDLRRRLGHLRQTVFAIAVTDFGVYAANHRTEDESSSWNIASYCGFEAVSRISPEMLDGSFSNARLSAIGRWIYILGRKCTVRYDTWSGTLSARSAMIFPRKKFAAAVVAGKIYVCGGASRTATVEEYDPESDTWRIVAESSRRRYGCIGASVDGVFYVIGGLKIGSTSSHTDTNRITDHQVRSESHLYASSMDLYDVKAKVWLRSRTVPGGGCVVAACAAAGGYVYVVASHAVELSFWRYDGRRSSVNGGLGEWSRMKSPPLLAQVRVDSTVRFCCVGVGENVVLVQVMGCIDDLLRRSGRSCRGLKEGLVLVYDSKVGEWSRIADLPEIIRRAACVCVEC